MKIKSQVISILVVLLIICSCNKNKIPIITPISFKERKIEPFPGQLASLPISIDTTIRITLIDSNRDGDYFDNTNNSVDFITITDINHGQFSGIVFQPILRMNFGHSSYTLEVDTLNKSAVLRTENSLHAKPDINIFHIAPDIKLKLQEDTTKSESIKSLVQKSPTKFVFVSFWANYCPGCIEEMEFYSINRLEINKAGLTVLSVSISEKLDDAISFINKHHYKGDFYVCSEEEMISLNCQGYPNGLLFDSSYNYIRHFSYSSINDILNYLNLQNAIPNEIN